MSVKTVLVDLLEWRGLTQSQLAKGLGIQKGKLRISLAEIPHRVS